MSDLVRTLNNLRSLRAAIKELSLEHAESMLAKLQTVIDEKRAEAEEALKADAERQAKVEKYKALIQKEGFSAADLAEIFNDAPAKKSRKPREPRPALYEYTDKQGNVKTWTGQGRAPQVIQEALKKGKSLDSFKIK